jgi:uncharacterized protein
MIAKKHVLPDKRLLLAVCDEDILGKLFLEGKKQLDLGQEFYKGEKLSEEEAIKLIKMACIVNAVGKNAVECCWKAGVIEEGMAKKIAGIPYLQIVSL